MEFQALHGYRDTYCMQHHVIVCYKYMLQNTAWLIPTERLIMHLYILHSSPKFIHFFTIPINAVLSMMFLAQFKLGALDETSFYASEFVFDINGSFILMLILVLLYCTIGLVRQCPTWGFTTAFTIFLLWGAVSYVILSNVTVSVYKYKMIDRAS